MVLLEQNNNFFFKYQLCRDDYCFSLSLFLNNVAMMIKNKPMNEVKRGISPLSIMDVPVAMIKRKPKIARGVASKADLD